MSREKMKVQATGNSNNPEVPVEVRKHTWVNADQHLYLEDTWEEKRGVATHLGGKVGIKTLCVFISYRKNFQCRYN